MNSTKIYTTPIVGNYKEKIEGVIKIKYRDDIKLNICKIIYELYENGEYQYIFEPYYDVLDALPSSLSQGIPGLNLEKRKKQYYRVNRVPSFVRERAMSEDRQDLDAELEKVCMKEYNPLEWLIRTDTEYSGDNLIVERYRLPRKISKINYNDLMYGDTLDHLGELEKDVEARANQLLKLIGSGVIINDESLTINSKSRTGALQLLINQYDTSVKHFASSSKEKFNHEGQETKKRRKTDIDDFVMEEIIKELELKIMSEMEAMKLINIKTRATLYKKIKEYKERKNK